MLVVIAGVFGLVINKVLDKASNDLGATLTYSSARGSIELYNYLDAVTADLVNVRLPLSGVLSYSGVIQPDAGATIAPGNVATSTITVTGAAVGDFVLVSFASSTYSTIGVGITGQVTNASTVTLLWQNTASSSTAFTAASTTVRVRVIPSGTFAAPAALTAATTTAANR